MKQVLLIMLGLISLTAAAQEKGKFEVYDFDKFKLHVYYTNDVMADASYIIEGKKGVVTLEQPLFKDNVSEYDAYLADLNKPVEQRIANYHLGGTGNHDIIMPQGMPEFAKGEIYGGMMSGFAQTFGDAIVSIPNGKTTEVKFETTQTYAGVKFGFYRGATTDFPAASIIIGNKVYYTHWTPVKAHMSHLQISSPMAIDAEIAEANKALNSGCELFIGGHGGATNIDAVKFKIQYLETMKEILANSKTTAAFIAAMKKEYPNLQGENGLEELAKALYE